RSPVFAYESELRAWLDSHQDEKEQEPTKEANASIRSLVPHGRVGIALAALAGLILIVGLGFGVSLFKSRAMPAAGGSMHAPTKEALAFYRAGLFERQTRTPAGLRHAVDDFTQAIVRDPQYAEAYAGLAQSYELLREYTT